MLQMFLCGHVAGLMPAADLSRGDPQHAYTKALIACIPKLGAKQRRLTTIDKEMALD